MIKSNPAEKQKSLPLFGTQNYTKILQKACSQAYQAYADRLPPAELRVL